MNQSNNEKMRCDNCRFYDIKYYDQNNPMTAGLGQCRRRPMIQTSTTTFLVVQSDDWCGDFEEASHPAP